MGKIKLSDTLRFLTARLNKIAGAHMELVLTTEEESVQAGEVFRATATVRAPEGVDRTLTCITFSLEGQVQREGRWQSYLQRAETAQEVPLPGGHEYVIPIVVKVPAEAVYSEDGAVWRLRAQAVVDRTIDPRDELIVTVVGD